MPIKRSVAHKLKLSDVLNAEFVKGSDIEHPNYIKLHGKEIIRVNVFGKVLDTYHSPESNYASITIQDLEEENAKIRIKLFGEETNFAVGIASGDLVKVIGKVREDELGRFILGEAVRKIEPNYVKLKKFEIEKFPEEKPVEPTEEKTETKEKPELVVEDAGKV